MSHRTLPGFLRTNRWRIWGMRLLLTLYFTVPSHANPPYQTGKMSYYHYSYKKKLASGERYTDAEQTAAHRSLPFGTVVEVKRLDTGTTTCVRINDRGPFVRGRIIDLNLAAARAVGIGKRGVVRCALRIIKEPKKMVQHLILRDDERPTRRATTPELEAILGQEFKVLDHGFIRLVDYMGNDDAIVQAARVSYGSGTKSVSEDSGLISYLIRHRHTSPFEMCSLKFHCKLPIFVARQWIRHRTAKVNELSARYSIIKDEFWMPDEWRGQSTNNKQGSEGVVDYNSALDWRRNDAPGAWTAFSLVEDIAFDEYNRRIDAGIGREQARSCLPLSTYTEWYWKIDLHNLMYFLKLRCDKHAQKEIRDYADVMAGMVDIGFPLTWQHFQNHVLNSATFSADEMKLIAYFFNGGGWNPSDPYINDILETELGKSRAREFKEKLNDRLPD